METKKVTGLAAAVFALSFMLITDAFADTVETKCRVRPHRSKVSVDGEGLAPGEYYAEVTSGGVTVKSDDIQTVSASGDEAEFDFDSNQNDIAEGATAIPVDFIQGRFVTGAIFNKAGQMVEDDGAKCRAKKGKKRWDRRGGKDDGPNHT